MTPKVIRSSRIFLSTLHHIAEQERRIVSGRGMGCLTAVNRRLWKQTQDVVCDVGTDRGILYIIFHANLDAHPKPHHYRRTRPVSYSMRGPRVVSYIRELYDDFASYVRGSILTYTNRNIKSGSEHIMGIVIGGYGLGGSIAMVCAADLISSGDLHPSRIPCVCYTLAPLRVGNGKLEAYVRSNLTAMVSWSFANDTQIRQRLGLGRFLTSPLDIRWIPDDPTEKHDYTSDHYLNYFIDRLGVEPTHDGQYRRRHG